MGKGTFVTRAPGRRPYPSGGQAPALGWLREVYRRMKVVDGKGTFVTRAPGRRPYPSGGQAPALRWLS